MDDTEARITLRLPTPLRDRLNAAAQESERSMNGEIVFRLDDFDRLTSRLKASEDLLEKREEMAFRFATELRRLEPKVTELEEQLKFVTESATHASEMKEAAERMLKEAVQENTSLRAKVGALQDEIRSLADRLVTAHEGDHGMKMAMIFDRMLENAAHGDDELLKRTLEAYRRPPPSIDELEERLREAEDAISKPRAPDLGDKPDK